MAFVVVKTTNPGGYQCSCCKHTYEETEWYETREEALAEVPMKISEGLEEIEIKDGSTGEVIASAQMSFSWGYGQYSAYKAQRWHGFIEPEPGQECIHIDDFRGPGETWEDSINLIQAEHLNQQKAEAKRKLEEAKRLAKLYGLEEG